MMMRFGSRNMIRSQGNNLTVFFRVPVISPAKRCVVVGQIELPSIFKTAYFFPKPTYVKVKFVAEFKFIYELFLVVAENIKLLFTCTVQTVPN